MRLKNFLSLSMASVLALNMVTGVTSAATRGSSLQFDFTKNDSGFTPIFADYPNSEGVEEFYEFHHEYGEVPIPGAGKGIFISGNNHSDDLFMGYVKMLEGFVPSKTYHFTVSFKLATNVESGLVGVGGSPGEGVAVKCGITSTEPMSTLVENGTFEYYRMNIDTGSQGNSGKDMVIVGDMAKTKNSRPGEYEFKEFHAEFDVTSNIRGEVFLIIGTDSGFEATTSYYLDDISVNYTSSSTTGNLKDISKLTISKIPDQPYTKRAIKPNVTIKNGKSILKYNRDYTVSYKNNIKTGKATVIIKGKGKYTGTKTITFRIKKNIKNSKLIVGKRYCYTGNLIKPNPTVKYDNRFLKKNKDYIVSYKKNRKIGTAQMIIKGKGQYAGTKTVTFIIE
ncbi:MAG: hypothetical protein KH355_11395 [Clostridiales bacterium]|nr:hypothetical protein [Clostridiales bacterium]